MRDIKSVRFGLVTAALGAASVSLVVLAAGAGASTLGATALGTANAKTAGAPTSQNELFCGTFTQGTDRFSGQSSIDHPSGANAMGNVYPYSGQTCKSNSASSSGMFTWSVGHSNVNTTTEKGTEHGEFTQSTSPYEAGFDGHVTDFDFGSTADYTCSDGRVIYYSSGHSYDSCGQPSGPGNFNTHGGAATGNHFRGNYGTIVYQDPNNNSCNTNSTTYCFEAILQGQTN